MFYILVKLIHIYIGKQLACQIPDGHSFFARSSALSLSLVNNVRITFNYFAKKPPRVFIFDSFFQYVDKKALVYGIKKLFHIALQNVARTSIIFAHRAKHFSCLAYTLMGAFADRAREGRRDKRRFKNNVQNPKHRMVQHSISHGRLVNVAYLRISNVKTKVWPVPIFLALQIPVQFENIAFQIKLKFRHIPLVALTFFESLPRYEKVFRADYLFK